MIKFALIIGYVAVIELLCAYINRNIVKNSDRFSDPESFKVHYSRFSMFTNLVVCASLAAFAVISYTNFGYIVWQNYATIFLLVIGLIDVARYPFYKLKIEQNLISYKSSSKKGNIGFSDITKVDVTKFLGMVFIEVYTDQPKKVLTVKNEMCGYSTFVQSLKKESIEWVDISGNAIDNKDF